MRSRRKKKGVEGGGGGDEYDEKYDEAVAFVADTGQASISLIQRRFHIGYNRAARIIEKMEARGYIGAFDGSNARQVLRREAGSVVAPPDADDGDGR